MRVAFDYQIFAFQRYGGISRYVVELAGELARRGEVSADVVAPLYLNAYLGKLRPDQVHGRPLRPFRGAARLALLAGRLLTPALMRRLPPDVVHETYYRLGSSAPEGVPVVITVHDMIHELYPDLFPAGDPTSARKKAAVARAAHILCISESTRRDLVRLMPEAEPKSSVVPLGFRAMPAGDSPAPAGSGRPYILYVGLRGGYKNFAGLLRAYAASPILREGFRLVCFGGGPFTSDEKRLTSELGLDPAAIVHLSGDDDRLAAAYRDAAVFAYPSLYEGFGIPPLEAMAQRCPVVCAGRSSLPEVCGPAAEYFDPDEPESLAAALERVLLSDARRAELVALGAERVGHFSWAKCADETLAVYRSLQ